MAIGTKNNKKEKGNSLNKKEFVFTKLNSKSKTQINFKPEIGGREKAADQSGYSASNEFPVSPAQQPQNPDAITQTQVAREETIVERVMDIPERRHRAAIMRRMSNILSRRREIARYRMAPEKRIKYRAQKLARSIMRRRLAGARGMHYGGLSPADKMAVDRIIDKKAKVIARLATRLVPVARRAELERLKAARAGVKTKPLTGAGGLGMMPRPKLDIADEYSQEAANDYICEQLSLYMIEGDKDRLDDLLRAGLADKSQLAQYQKALDNPEQAQKNSVLRTKIYSTLDKLIKTILGNPSVYYKLKNDIQRKYQRASMTEETLEEAKGPKLSDMGHKVLKGMAASGHKGAKAELARRRAATVESKKPIVQVKDAIRDKQKANFAATVKTVAKGMGAAAPATKKPAGKAVVPSKFAQNFTPTPARELSVDYIKDGPKWNSGSSIARAAKAGEEKKRSALLPMVVGLYNAHHYFTNEPGPQHPGDFVPPTPAKPKGLLTKIGTAFGDTTVADYNNRRYATAKQAHQQAVNAATSFPMNKAAAHRLVSDHINLTLKLGSPNISPEKKSQLAKVLSVYNDGVKQLHDTAAKSHHQVATSIYKKLNDHGLLHHMVEEEIIERDDPFLLEAIENQMKTKKTSLIEKLIEKHRNGTLIAEQTGVSPALKIKGPHPSHGWPRVKEREQKPAESATLKKKVLKK